MPEAIRPTVLLVEDEALLRLVIAEELRDAGFDVVEAGDGGEAMGVLSTEAAVDLLFTDIRMPGLLSGWDVAERAREIRHDLPVIYASGFSDNELRIVPGGRFLKKPYRAGAIIEAAGELGIRPVSNL